MRKQKDIRKKRIRAKIKGTEKRPRLSVFRSNSTIYAQLIDDVGGRTLLSITEKHLEEKPTTKSKRAKQVGFLLAQKAKEKKINSIVFDKGSYAYHGRVKELAEGAREGGLQF